MFEPTQEAAIAFVIWAGIISALIVTPAFWRVVGGVFRSGTGFLLIGLFIGAVMEGIRWVLDSIFGPLDYKTFFESHDLAAICGNPSNTGACPYIDNGGVTIIIVIIVLLIGIRWLLKDDEKGNR